MLLREYIETQPLLRELKYRLVPYLHAIRFKIFASKERKKSLKNWHLGVENCPDSKFIPRVPGAGSVRWGFQTMHCGVKVVAGCYYGYENMKMLERTGGVHEPQEERVFGEVLKHMPPDATMIELGSYWSFYSIWFASVVQRARCFLVEPLLSNLNYGRRNFAANRMEGTFIQAFVGEEPGMIECTRQICVDELVAEHKIARINILHVDIQGYEGAMLKGARQSIDARVIDYLFISTHSNELHAECTAFLADRHYVILASADLDDSFGPDGVLVARREELDGLAPVLISSKKHATQ